MTVQAIRRTRTFNDLFRLEKVHRCQLSEPQWIAVMQSFRYIASRYQRSDVIESGNLLASRVSRHISSSSIALAGETALTFGKLGIYNPQVIEDCRHVDLRGARVVDLTRCLWGPLLLKDLCRDHYQKVAIEVEEVAAQTSKIALDDCRRLHLCSLIGRVRWGDEVLGTNTQRLINQGIDIIAEHPTNPSKFQNEVTAFVRRYTPPDWVMETEYFLEGFHIDIAFPSQKLAIEADGPSHFYPGSDETVTKDRVKDEILEGLGWRVLHVSYKDWEKGLSPSFLVDYLDKNP